MRRRRTLTALAGAAAIAALALVQAGAAGPGSLGAFFFGPKLVRAEVIMQDRGTTHDDRVARGKVRAVAPGSVTLLERDGTTVTVPVQAGADIRLDGRSVGLRRLRLLTARGVALVATTIRDGDRQAQTIRVERGA
jgi:hypothetical protein